jgi:tetratricopeptide (TPR) repeat protein
MKRGLFIAALILTACSSQDDNVLKVKSVLTPSEMLIKIRSNNEVQNEVVFTALPDDAVIDLLGLAERAEQAGDYVQANSLLNKAIQIDAKNPQVSQMLAEIALLQEYWTNAEKFALQSYQFGPKLGGLCRRNWLTVHFAKAAQGQPMADYVLAKNLNECTLVPPVRM